MFTITAERARYYANRSWIDNIVEIDLRSCLRSIAAACDKGSRSVDVEAPWPEDWTTLHKGNDERIERVLDELRDRGFCVVHRYIPTSDPLHIKMSYAYHIEW
jgi:hypothetical protein